MLYIFGAHSRARTLAAYIRFLEPDKTICGFLVDNDEENPDEVDGVKVIDLKTSKTHNESLENFNFLEERENDGACDARASLGLDTSLPVYIATRGIYHEGIESRLKELGFKNIIKVTPAFDMEIRNGDPARSTVAVIIMILSVDSFSIFGTNMAISAATIAVIVIIIATLPLPTARSSAIGA